MTRAHRRFLGTEAGVAAVINAILSAAFVTLVFGRDTQVAVASLVLDALPQSLMITFMGSIVPTLLTRRRVRAGRIAPLPPLARGLPKRVVVRALVLAMVFGLGGFVLQWLLLPSVRPEPWPFAAALVYKTVYGSLLGAAVGVFAARAALGDR